MTLDLGSIKFKVTPTKYVKVSGIGIFEQFKEVARSKEEIF
jgi:hypothetical protein